VLFFVRVRFLTRSKYLLRIGGVEANNSVSIDGRFVRTEQQASSATGYLRTKGGRFCF
jgi:hypothetical protein